MKRKFWPEAKRLFQPRHAFNAQKFWRRYRRAVPWIIIFIVLGACLEITGLTKGFEFAGLDTLLRTNDRVLSNRIVIVEITDDDYETLFHGKSPLQSDLLLDLVPKIQDYGPRVIGMDFDTGSKHFWGANEIARAQTLTKSAVVWAEVPCDIHEPLRLAPVLGGQPADPIKIGIPRFPVDSDGVVRRYDRDFAVRGDYEPCPPRFVHVNETEAEDVQGRPHVPSFANAVVDEYRRGRGAQSEQPPSRLSRVAPPLPYPFVSRGARRHYKQAGPKGLMVTLRGAVDLP